MREGKSRQLRNMVATGGADGMQTIEMDLARLVAVGSDLDGDGDGLGRTRRRSRPSWRPPVRRLQAQATMSTGQAGSSGSGDRTARSPPEAHWRRRRRSRSAEPVVVKKSPFKNIAGVTPCPGGWLVLPARLAGVTMAAEDAFVVKR